MDQAAKRSGPGGSAEGQTVTVDESSETADNPVGGGDAALPRPEHAARDQEAGYAEASSTAFDVSGGPQGADSPGAASSGDPTPGAGSPEGEPASRPAEPAGPRPWWQWLYLPFLMAWRFAFPKKPRPFIVELPFLLAIALVLAFIIKTFLVQAFVIPSGSMQQTLEINDRVLVNRFSNWTGHQPNRGDIVVFQDPGGWLESEPVKPKNVFSKALTAVGLLPEDNGDLIKRVIGVGGDDVECKGSGSPVTVNGVPLQETGYLYPSNQPSMEPFEVHVPKGFLWVMGDHREVSVDSRAHIKGPTGGFVPVGNVVGVAVMKVWPPSHFGTLPVPSTFKQKFQALSAPGAVPVAAFALAVPITVVRRRRKLRKLEALQALGL